MFRRKPTKPEAKKKRAWEEDLERDEDVEQQVPSEAFLSLQKELETKQLIQKENEERDQRRGAEAEVHLKAINAKADKLRENARNTRVYLEIEVADDTRADSRLKKGERVGKIVCELFFDRVPQTAENFRALCTGEKPRGASGFPMSYLGNIFHRIVPNFMAQGGDITREDGSGGESIYGPTFKDESFEMKHDAPGLLSMANSGRDSNNSQFFVTFDALPWLDGKHVVFGKVVEGMEVVRQIEDCGTTSGEPTKRVQIAECGQLKAESSGEEDSDEESEEDESSDGRPRQRKRARVRFAKP